MTKKLRVVKDQKDYVLNKHSIKGLVDKALSSIEQKVDYIDTDASGKVDGFVYFVGLENGLKFEVHLDQSKTFDDNLYAFRETFTELKVAEYRKEMENK